MTGKTLIIYKKTNKGKKSVANYSTLYQAYTPTVNLKTQTPKSTIIHNITTYNLGVRIDYIDGRCVEKLKLAIWINSHTDVFIRVLWLRNLHSWTHWGPVTHICVGTLTIIVSENGLSPGRRQAIIWTNAGILLTGPQGTNFSEILTGIQAFSFKKMHLKMSSAKWRPFCFGLNVLIHP